MALAEEMGGDGVSGAKEQDGSSFGVGEGELQVGQVRAGVDVEAGEGHVELETRGALADDGGGTLATQRVKAEIDGTEVAERFTSGELQTSGVLSCVLEEDAADLTAEVRRETAQAEHELVDFTTVGAVSEGADDVDGALVADGAVSEIEEREFAFESAKRDANLGAGGGRELVATDGHTLDGAGGSVDFEESSELAECEATIEERVGTCSDAINDGTGE